MQMLTILLILTICSITEHAYAGVMADTFAKGGIGYAIVQLLLVAAATMLFSTITSALGKGQIAKMISILGVFSCIGIVANLIISVIASVAKAFGIQL